MEIEEFHGKSLLHAMAASNTDISLRSIDTADKRTLKLPHSVLHNLHSAGWPPHILECMPILSSEDDAVCSRLIYIISKICKSGNAEEWGN